MGLRSNGHVVSDGIPQYKKTEGTRKYFGLMKVRIDSVTYVDELANNSFEKYGFKAVQYTCRVIGSQYDGSTVKGVIDASELGGQFNYSEFIRQGVEEQPLQTLSGDTPPNLTNGDFALVMCLYGDMENCVIIRGFPHPKNKKIGAKRLDGKRGKFEFNGVEFNIDKSGNLRVRQVGTKTPLGIPTNPTGIDSELILHKNGDLEFNAYGAGGDSIPASSSNKDLRVKFTKLLRQIELYAQDNKVVMDLLGIILQDKNGNKGVLDPTGILVQDRFGNKMVMSPTGVTMQDINGNKIEQKAGKMVMTGAPFIELNGAISGITTANSHQGVVDFITGVPVLPSLTVKGDV